MIRRDRRIQIYSVFFHIGVLFMLFVTIGIYAVLMPKTASLATTEGSYNELPVLFFSDETLLDKDHVVNRFSREEIDAHIVPLPTLALLFPLALLLWVKRCRWLIQKRQNFFAFPVF